MRSARWEASQWWPDAQEEANDRWLRALKGEARKGLLKNIRDGDAARARWLLERTDPRLAPPRLPSPMPVTKGWLIMAWCSLSVRACMSSVKDMVFQLTYP